MNELGAASYELLITDFSFGGGMGGKALPAEWRASYPGRPLIFAMVNDPDDIGPLAKGEVFLPKPYGTPQILEAVHNLLPGQEATRRCAFSRCEVFGAAPMRALSKRAGRTDYHHRSTDQSQSEHHGYDRGHDDDNR